MSGTFLRPVEGLAHGDHACLVYDREERRDAALLRFLGEGLARGERVVYVARDADDPLARELDRRARRGQLVLHRAEDAYLQDGDFDPLRLLGGIRSVLDEAAALGFPGVRTAGGPPPAVAHNGLSHRLPAYERAADSLFDGVPLVSVCAYDARRVPPTALLGIIDAHPVVLYALAEDDRLRVRTVRAGELAASGWLDITTLGALAGPLAAALGRDGDVALDLHDLDFVDVAGLRLLSDAALELRGRGHTLTLRHAPPQVPAMLRLLRWDGRDGLVLG